MNNKNSVIIIGCSLSGMLSALSLSKIGYQVTIIESNDVNNNKFLNDIRTTAITIKSKRFLEYINLWDSIEKFACPMYDVYVVDNKSPLILNFNHTQINHDNLGYILQNNYFKKSLLEAIRKNNSINIIDNCNNYTLKHYDGYCEVEVNNKILTSDFILLCCARKSLIYKKYFHSHQLLKSYKYEAITFHVHHEKSHEYTAVEHFMTTGPFAILPLKDVNTSSIVWSVEKDYADLLLKLPADEFLYHIQNNFGEFLGKIKITTEIARFPLIAYLTNRYFYKNLVVIADTAHVVHPLAGQGLNQGIKDILMLSKLIENNNNILSNELLIKYEENRKYDNHTMYLITDSLNKIFSNDIPILNLARKIGLSTINKIPMLKSAILKYATGI